MCFAIMPDGTSYAQHTPSDEITGVYGTPMSIAETIAQVHTEAQLHVHTKLLKALVQEPTIQHINTVTPIFSPPDMNGLVYYLYDFSFKHSVDPTTKTITGSVAPTLRFPHLRQAVLDVLATPHSRSLLERYGAIVAAQKTSLRALNKSLTDRQAGAPQPSRPSSESEAGASVVGNRPVASPQDNAPNTLSDVAQHAATLSVLHHYQTLLRQYTTQWANPEATYTQLLTLAQKSPDNPLVQGAIAEVLLQLNKPHEAQLYSDRALANKAHYAYLYDTRGAIFLQLKLPTLATQDFTKAIAIDGHNPLFYLHRADSYLPRNKTAAMCEDFNQACVLGDCSSYQWAFEQQLCDHNEALPLAAPANQSPDVFDDSFQGSPLQSIQGKTVQVKGGQVQTDTAQGNVIQGSAPQNAHSDSVSPRNGDSD